MCNHSHGSVHEEKKWMKAILKPCWQCIIAMYDLISSHNKLGSSKYQYKYGRLVLATPKHYWFITISIANYQIRIISLAISG
jgi:hypothetical protein